MKHPGRRGETEVDVVTRLESALSVAPGIGPPLGRFNALLTQFLAALAEDTTASSSYLTQVHAVDPGMAARLHTQFVTRLVDIFDARGASGRFACHVLVAAITAMTTQALVEGDDGALAALHQPLVLFAERTLC